MESGRISTPKGFTIIGNVPTEDVAEAAIEALKRLRAGEAELAQHPNCGTNYVISGIFAGFGAWLGVVGTGKGFGKKVQRLPIMMLLATLALILTRRLGPIVQKEITTSSDPRRNGTGSRGNFIANQFEIPITLSPKADPLHV